MSLDDRVSELYRLPLEEFTAARDTLSKQLRGDGDKEAAARVKALKKPNIAAWALNQLAHRHPDELEELFEVTSRVRDAQRKVMSGRKADLRAATDERNAVVGRLTKLAQEILEEGGHGAAGQTMSAIADSLVAVASDEQGAEALRGGRLSREFKPGAVVDVGVLGVVPDDEEEPGAERDTDAGKRVAIEAAQRRAEEASLQADAAEAEARRQADEAEQADRRAKSAAEAAEFARRAAEARRAEADEAAEALRRLEE